MNFTHLVAWVFNFDFKLKRNDISSMSFLSTKCLSVVDVACTALKAQTAGEKLYLADPQGMDELMFSLHITSAIYMSNSERLL